MDVLTEYYSAVFYVSSATGLKSFWYGYGINKMFTSRHICLLKIDRKYLGKN